MASTLTEDGGLPQILPEPCVDPPCERNLAERNVLYIKLNQNGELMANKTLIDYSELRETLIRFIDNNGDRSCDYCEGIGYDNASDNPSKAFIALQTDRASRYADFITIQVELNRAYWELREKYANRMFEGRSFSQLNPLEIKQVRDAYPLLVSELFQK